MKNENMISRSEKGIVIIGSGRFAGSLARSMPERIIAIVSRNAGNQRGTERAKLNIPVVDSFSAVDRDSYGAVWIATSDASISEVAESIAPARDSWEGIVVVHSSGATPVNALDALRARGAFTIALHPNGSFTGAAPISAGLVWGISSHNPDFMGVAEELIGPLHPMLVPIEDRHRALYHAAASMAANYSITLFSIAMDLYMRAGLPESRARDVVAAFMAGSAANARALGPRAALTGPVARGDMEVVARQIGAIGADAPEYIPLFIEMTMRTAMLIDEENSDAWRELIRRSSAVPRVSEEPDGEIQAERGTPEAQSGQEDAS
ncbi:MAG: Rossmann-like and DUF2520 domain-containing protein [Candidatus Kapaibacterium sp.]